MNEHSTVTFRRLFARTSNGIAQYLLYCYHNISQGAALAWDAPFEPDPGNTGVGIGLHLLRLVSGLSQGDGDDFSKCEIKKYENQKLIGYIIDLRNNPGGLLNQAIAITDFFL